MHRIFLKLQLRAIKAGLRCHMYLLSPGVSFHSCEWLRSGWKPFSTPCLYSFLLNCPHKLTNGAAMWTFSHGLCLSLSHITFSLFFFCHCENLFFTLDSLDFSFLFFISVSIQLNIFCCPHRPMSVWGTCTTETNRGLNTTLSLWVTEIFISIANDSFLLAQNSRLHIIGSAVQKVPEPGDISLHVSQTWREKTAKIHLSWVNHFGKKGFFAHWTLWPCCTTLPLYD